MNDQTHQSPNSAPEDSPDTEGRHRTKEPEKASAGDDATGFDLKSIARDFGGFERVIHAVTASSRRGGSVDDLEKALRAIPDDLGHQIVEVKQTTLRRIGQERGRRGESLGRALGDFISQLRADGVQVREADGWRIGRLQLEIRRELGEVRIAYNRQVLVPWTSVAGPRDLGELYRRAEASLDAQALPEDALVEGLWNAYRHASAEGSDQGRIRIRDLHRELRTQLVRRELRTKADRAVKVPALPTWAFLFNLDRYRDLGLAVPVHRRLLFETGSQRETEQFGVVLNGLHPEDGYKTYCFVRSVER